MSNILTKASNAINIWNQVRNNPNSVINYFNQGCAFLITRADYVVWELHWKNLNRPTDFSIHSYFGLVLPQEQVHFSLALFSLDSYTDALSPVDHTIEYLSYLKESPFQASLTGEVQLGTDSGEFDTEITRALQASTTWTLYKDQWIHSQNDMVQLFKVPFTDLISLFSDDLTQNLVLIPALTYNDSGTTLDIDFMIWAQQEDTGIIWQDNPRDFLQPCPPYCGDIAEYQLLQYSISS